MSIAFFVLGALCLVTALRARRSQARRTRTLKALLRECRFDRDILRQQLRIVRAERDFWISKHKALLLPEVSE